MYIYLLPCRLKNLLSFILVRFVLGFSRQYSNLARIHHPCVFDQQHATSYLHVHDDCTRRPIR